MENKNPMIRLWELGEKEHGRLIGAIICAVIGVVGGMLPYFAAAQIIIALIHGEQNHKFYILWAGIAFMGYLIRSVLYAVALSTSHKATFSILKDVRKKILDKLPRMSLGTITDISSGQMKQIIVDQVESMERPLAHLLPEMTSNILGPVCILIYLFILDWRMALLSLVSIPIGMLFMVSAMKGYGEKYEGSVKTTQKMNETIVEYINGIEVIKAFNQGKNSYGKYTDRVTANASYFYNWMKSCQLPTSLSKAIFPTTLITILPVGWILYQKANIDTGVFITTIILSLAITEPLMAAMNFVDSLARVGTIVESIDSILLGEEQVHKDKKVKIKNSHISMKNVCFGYHEKEILHNVTLEIPSGTMTAFVGPSGSGKSTIAKLIAGFWDVEHGEITIGGYNLKDIPLNQLYDEVAFVSQDNYLFDDSVRENIRMGNLNATDEEVERIAKLAGCHEFIQNLEYGYETVVGGGGAHLSGGERQRIAIARAMLKDAPIIILDEATAYIDPENEAVIQKAVAKLIKGKTVIVIAHRLSTIIDADQIYLICNGQVQDFGTHKKLLKSGSLYESMWKAHIGAKDGEIA